MGSRFTQNRFPLCPLPPRHHRHRAPPTATLCASSPNFVANLRATKSAPFDFTLIRCQCRAVDEANLSLIYRVGYRRGFHFPRSVPFLPRQAGLFQGNYFPSLFGSHSSIVPVFLCFSSFSVHPTCSPFPLPLSFSFPTLLSPYLDLVSRNSALTSIRGRSKR